MDLRDSEEEATFRTEVRAFISSEAPKTQKGVSGEESLAANWEANQEWFKKLAS